MSRLQEHSRGEAQYCSLKGTFTEVTLRSLCWLSQLILANTNSFPDERSQSSMDRRKKIEIKDRLISSAVVAHLHQVWFFEHAEMLVKSDYLNYFLLPIISNLRSIKMIWFGSIEWKPLTCACPQRCLAAQSSAPAYHHQFVQCPGKQVRENAASLFCPNFLLLMESIVHAVQVEVVLVHPAFRHIPAERELSRAVWKQMEVFYSCWAWGRNKQKYLV